jgi:glycosyltransferase involved in cell wall biosynthesis
MKHRVLIDAISLLSPLTGIGRYTYEISKELNSIDKYDLEYFYGYYSKKLKEPSNTSNRFKSLLLENRLLKRLIRYLISIFSRFFAPSYDLYWQPNFIPNIGIRSNKVITTVHDLSFIRYSDFHPRERIEYYNRNFFSNIYRSDIIITGSNFVKDEIICRLDIPQEMIRVIYHGVDHNIFRVYENTSINFELPEKFILSVCSIEPRKNLLGLLEAYTLLSKEIKRDYKLVLVGAKGWNNEGILEFIEKNRLDIVNLGFLSDRDLALVYNRASLFVYIPFYEGFGIPPLEAYACGTPVVVSNIPSLLEVCDGGAIYCDPHLTGDIKQKIEMVLNDRLIQMDMIQKGFKRSKMFSWEISARKHLKVFQEVLNI